MPNSLRNSRTITFEYTDGVAAGILSQRDSPDDPWHPVGFFSEALHGAELNYGIHDKEMLAVIKGLMCWRPELIGLQTPRPFTIITALEYFTVKRLLNLRQANWAELISHYNFVITYRPGSRNTVADILSHCGGEPWVGYDDQLDDSDGS